MPTKAELLQHPSSTSTSPGSTSCRSSTRCGTWRSPPATWPAPPTSPTAWCATTTAASSCRLAGSLISAGLKKVFVDAIRSNMVDAIVSTGANIVDQDFFEALGFQHYVGEEKLQDAACSTASCATCTSTASTTR